MLMKWHYASSSTIYIASVVFLLTLIEHPIGAVGRSDHGVPGVPHIAALRRETEELFYHGFENYITHAFPEDELRPLSCKPMTRDRANPAHFEVNDALGNYSLTLIDSLSTLAVLSSSPSGPSSSKALRLFQDSVKALVEQYGDGSTGVVGLGVRARGFDLDSKVQVFETAIRGLGGLLSAHLFAVGELPITGYEPPHDQLAAARVWTGVNTTATSTGIYWDNGFTYDGQLLRLAYDLGKRLKPAFWTSTGIPYPRVNLRHGIPFYANSTGNYAPEGQCDTEKKEPREVTETCSAGAGSLVLEFTVLSRLTNDSSFEELAKRAFWAVWDRRSQIDLIGAGIDAESGAWQHSWTGIGAGIDSFFEYAFKSHVLLAGQSLPESHTPIDNLDPRSVSGPLPSAQHEHVTFLSAWETAHAAIKRHIYRGINFQHPHYIQVDQSTGAARAFWIDALSAYYPGLLAMSGHVGEAIETHLLSTALWARFSALPERYNVATGGIDSGLGWWVGRPELIESTWYLYRATEDPWYVYVGEMILRDIKRRCWTRCGWAGIQNVLTGEKIDRMESFFLGETAKYLFLLFDPEHPLNKLDAAFVLTTEGHPLIIPQDNRAVQKQETESAVSATNNRMCPAKLSPLPFSLSNIAARGDVYHAASLARLHLMPQPGQIESVLAEYAADHPSITLADVQSPSNWTYYPWTLPLELIPRNAVSSPMPAAPTFELSFPTMQNQGNPLPPLQRVKDGILINFIGGLRLSMVQDVPMFVNDDYTTGYRIQAINNVGLGKDEKVYLAHNTQYKALNPQDPLFSRVRDIAMLDLVVERGPQQKPNLAGDIDAFIEHNTKVELPALNGLNDGPMKAAWNRLLTQLSGLVRDAQGIVQPLNPSQAEPSASIGTGRLFFPAITPTGVGAAPLPDWQEASALNEIQAKEESLPWIKVFAAGELCDEKLAVSVVKSHQIVLVRRGSCSFSKKLSNIPTVPGRAGLQLVVVVDYESIEQTEAVNDVFGIGASSRDFLTRPLLDETQTTSGGLPRQNPIPMVMVGGGEKTYRMLRNAKSIGVKRRYSVNTQGFPIANLMIV